MICVFTGVNQLPDNFIDTCQSFLPEWRMKQVMSYRYPSDRKLCALAYLLLVYALRKKGLFHSLPEFGFGTGGKPFLKNYNGIYFNLSHCKNAVVCILSDKEVGIDVERVCEYDDELAQAICNNIEYQWINGFPDLELKAKHFTGLLTRKESFVKWRGTGFSCDPREIFSCNSSDIPDEDFQIVSLYYQTENLYISVCRNNN